MNGVQHDFIIVEPEVSKGVLKMPEGDINSGIVKEYGPGYYADNGLHVANIEVKEGDKVIFTQHLKLDIDGEEIYIVRGRDVIKVIDGNKA